MRRFFVLTSLAVLFAPGVVAADEALRTQAALDLKRFYEERLRQPIIARDDAKVEKVGPPPWVEPIKQLSAAKPEDRRHAADYLRELVSQAADDEYAKTAPWRALPFWGGGSEVPARDLRESVANELGKAGPLPDGLPVLRWYLENERIDTFLEPVMTALGKLGDKEANVLRGDLVTKPHENAIVLAEALKQLAAHQGTLPAEKLQPLLQNHRAVVRAAAGALWKQQSGKEPLPFDAARAMHDPIVRKLVAELDAMLIDAPAASAPWLVAKVTVYDKNKKERDKFDQAGWLVKQDGDKRTLFTPWGTLETVRKSAELTRDNDRENWRTCSIAEGASIAGLRGVWEGPGRSYAGKHLKIPCSQEKNGRG